MFEDHRKRKKCKRKELSHREEYDFPIWLKVRNDILRSNQNLSLSFNMAFFAMENKPITISIYLNLICTIA